MACNGAAPRLRLRAAACTSRPLVDAMRGSSGGHGWLGTWLRVLLATLVVAFAGAERLLNG